ncbi:galactosyltransferase-related protein [Bacillus sp. es.034]|uniref:galactosyltransferase-related protein n=1 Tax=Bacillus sp. es.034 TaxID=1761763 RepID=UPI000BF877F1|nr:galactosyltransferase-related protein [Bacillus sp. es.034]PFG06628.1 galactosyltransferase-like protein [Bacillus sp. es.034]
MIKLSVLVPYKPDHGPRDEAFRWVKLFYQKYMPFAEICLGHSESKLFSRSQAINDAAKKAKTDLFLIADNDIFYDPNLIIEANAKLKDHAWVIPYMRVYDIKEESTKKLLKTKPSWPLTFPIQSKVRAHTPNGGLTLIPRKHFEVVNGFDERFIGWGGEDDAFAFSVNNICGKQYRMNKEIYHLWHPNNKQQGNPNYQNNYTLLRKYFETKGDIQKLKKLIINRQN